MSLNFMVELKNVGRGWSGLVGGRYYGIFDFDDATDNEYFSDLAAFAAFTAF